MALTDADDGPLSHELPTEDTVHSFPIRFGFRMGLLLALLITSLTVGNINAQDEPSKELILATTTSTQDSGLLDVLIPLFEDQTGFSVKPVAVGSGAAMKLGEEGNADVLLVHSPGAELDFMEAGYGSDRQLVFYNDFVVVGPPDDPAGLKGMTTASQGLNGVESTGSPFISRGDDSGTHKLELNLWESADIQPEGSWYVESGTGMGATLSIASERQAYTITDRGTWLALEDNLDLEILIEGDAALINPYHVITVNADGNETINVTGADAFRDFLLAAETQEVIALFGVEEYGQPLFIPCAKNSCGLEGPNATPVAATPVAIANPSE